jgi:hypothetical protein
MKRLLLGAVVGLTVFMMCGCGNGINYDLPDEPQAFLTESYIDPSDKDDGYETIVYNGRRYIPYGTLGKTLKGDDVGECLGYIVQDGVADKNTRVYVLTADKDVNYLAEINTEGFMDQPIFLRAEDTIGKDIDTPSYIESLNYGIWR